VSINPNMRGTSFDQENQRQGSSFEAFLDQYQAVRLFVAAGGLAILVVFLVAGWWQWGSPLPNLVAVLGIAAHAGWCRIRRIRAPTQMLLIDITLFGWSVLAIADLPVIGGFYGLLALVTVLFTEGWRRWGLLAYLTAWFVSAFLLGSGLSVDSVGSLIGTLGAVAGLVAVVTMLRGWLGRLDANRSQMLGTVSHELRNSLTGVLGLTEVVSNMDDLEPAEVRELIEMANQQAIDATEIVEDLLTASRLERSAMTTQATPVDINTEVATTIRRFQGAGTEVAVTLADVSSEGWGDPLRVRQILRNLVSNAIRYGGPDIVVATKEIKGALEIVVRDNGNGVPPEDEGTIFLPYRRSTRGRRDAASVGLGLWISHQLAHTMGGSLTYQRRDAHTEFVLSIPRAPETTSTADVAAASSRTTNRSRHLGTSKLAHDPFAVA
jgi:signal transduction histidine kinase